MNKYMDIINYNYIGVSRNHMSIYERSAQFAPFAALTGFDGAINESGRMVDTKIELSEDEKIDINDKINNCLNKNICVTYFIPDRYKDGGRYENYTGVVRKIDTVYKYIVFMDKKVINIYDIIFIKVEN